MGTTQQIIHKKIGKRVKIGALVLSPFILIGVASIIFQLSSIKNGEYTLFDFNLGKLWSWAISSNKDDSPEMSLPVQSASPLLPIIESQIAERNSTIREIFLAKPREVKSVQTAAANADIGKIEILPALHVQNIKPVEWYTPLRTSRFFEPMEKEFLISPDIKVKRSKMAVGASFAPSLTYRSLAYGNLGDVARIDNQTAYTYGQSQEYRKRHDKAIMNFYSGLDVYMNLTDRWTFQTGFYYASYGEKLQVIKLDDDGSSLPVSNSENSPFKGEQALFDSPEMVEYDDDQMLPFSNYYGMIEVPLTISYKALDVSNQLTLEVQAGVSYAFMDHADMLLYDYETNKYYWINTSAFELLNQHLFSTMAGISISQYISKEIEVFANPQFKYSLTPTFTQAYEIKQHQWATGLRLGMKVHL